MLEGRGIDLEPILASLYAFAFVVTFQRVMSPEERARDQKRTRKQSVFRIVTDGTPADDNNVIAVTEIPKTPDDDPDDLDLSIEEGLETIAYSDSSRGEGIKGYLAVEGGFLFTASNKRFLRHYSNEK